MPPTYLLPVTLGSESPLEILSETNLFPPARDGNPGVGMSEALLELVHSALLMTHSLAKSWLKAGKQGAWVFDEAERVLAWKTPGGDIESRRKNRQQGKLCRAAAAPGQRHRQGKGGNGIGSP